MGIPVKYYRHFRMTLLISWSQVHPIGVFLTNSIKRLLRIESRTILRQSILKMKIAFLVLVFTSVALAETAGCIYSRGKYEVVFNVTRDDSKYLAWVDFSDKLFKQGFGELHVHANHKAAGASDAEMMKCAGLIEGMVTAQRISDGVYLYKNHTLEDFGTPDWPDNLVNYIRQNMNYSKTKSSLLQKVDKWWKHVYLVITHTEAILEGYNKAKKANNMNITDVDWWIYQSAGDMDDLEVFIELLDIKRGKPRRYTAPKSSKLNLPFSDQWYDTHHHCTGLIFATPGFTDAFVSHDSWSGFFDMNRITKDYDFDFSTGAKRMIFSSAPGRSYSMDDFWQIDNNLVVIETTLHNWDNDLYLEYCKPSQIFTWIRVQVANRIAENGKDWCETFIRENSGTYNNQYIVVDYNKFKPGQKAQAGFIWAIEQLPGYYNYGDRTDEFNTNRYIPSLNTPFFEDVYEKAKYPEKVIETNSTYWSYWDNSRMHIVERDVPNLKDYEDFKTFMRSNDWEHDPLTNYDPAEAILSRYDLRPDDCIPNGNSLMCPNVFGGTDSKTTNYNNVMNHKFDFISSPQYETQPAWEFGVGKYANYDYTGLPQKWTFPRLSFGYDD